MLTKRPARISSLLPADWCDGYPNVWLGTTVDDKRHGLPRVDVLRILPAAVRFLSVEPLLEGLGEFDLSGISWVIVGGESGRGARPFDLDWARSIKTQCLTSGARFFMKQLGARPEMTPGPIAWPSTDAKGGNMAEWPEDLRVQDFPEAR